MKHRNSALALALSTGLFLASCTSGPTGTTAERLRLVEALPYLQPEAAPDLTAGHPVVVEFWATWCPPCVESVPHLVQLDAELGPEGLVLVGVHAARGADDEAGVRKFVEAKHVQYAIALDREGKAGEAFGVTGIPTAFVFDKTGKLVWEGHPLEPGFEGAVEKVVNG